MSDKIQLGSGRFWKVYKKIIYDGETAVVKINNAGPTNPKVPKVDLSPLKHENILEISQFKAVDWKFCKLLAGKFVSLHTVLHESSANYTIHNALSWMLQCANVRYFFLNRNQIK